MTFKSMPVNLSPEHRSNLRRLADYLDALPEDYAGFDMDNYERKTPDCGTIRCAAGHGPLALPEYPRSAQESWEDYTDRVFGLVDLDDWDWCFSGRWQYVDNTFRGADARIRYLLDHGRPENSYYQMLGRAPLCYVSQAARAMRNLADALDLDPDWSGDPWEGVMGEGE